VFLCIAEQFRDASDDLAGDFTANIFAVVVVLHQHLDRGVPGEFSGSTDIAVGLFQRCRDCRMPEPMRPDAQFVAHRPKDFVYAVPRETLAGENAITFADSHK
jgi:hypothetical protein